MKSKLFSIIVAYMLLVSCITMLVRADEYEVNDDFSRTGSLEFHEYDVYEVTPIFAHTLYINITTQNSSVIDFYLMDESQLRRYEAYEDFRVLIDKENSTSCNFVIPWQQTMYLVVDNMLFSSTGAFPDLNVTYEIEIGFMSNYYIESTDTENDDDGGNTADTDNSDSIISEIGDSLCSNVFFILIFMVIMTCVWFFSKPKEGKGGQQPPLVQPPVGGI